MHVPGAVKRVITPTIRHLDQLLLDALIANLGRVHKVRGAELLPPLLLAIVHIHHDDLLRSVLHASLHYAQPHAPGAEDRDIRPLLDAAAATARGDDGSAVAGRDATAQQAGPVHGRLVRDGDDRDVGHDRVLAEGGCSHKVQQVLALALEARGPVRHHAAALRGADLAAEVRLARLAELAFAAFGGAVGAWWLGEWLAGGVQGEEGA